MEREPGLHLATGDAAPTRAPVPARRRAARWAVRGLIVAAAGATWLLVAGAAPAGAAATDPASVDPDPAPVVTALPDPLNDALAGLTGDLPLDSALPAVPVVPGLLDETLDETLGLLPTLPLPDVVTELPVVGDVVDDPVGTLPPLPGPGSIRGPVTSGVERLLEPATTPETGAPLTAAARGSLLRTDPRLAGAEAAPAPAPSPSDTPARPTGPLSPLGDLVRGLPGPSGPGAGFLLAVLAGFVLLVPRGPRLALAAAITRPPLLVVTPLERPG